MPFESDIIVNSEYYKSLFRFQNLTQLLGEFMKHAKNLGNVLRIWVTIVD